MPSPGRTRVSAAEVEAIPGAVPEENPTPARLEALSDGVFSIILTLLVLDLRVPGVDAFQRTSLADALRHQWPVYVAYVLSFLQVGVVWANHHSMFHYVRRTDHLLKVLNLLFLLWVAVLPFTTALMSEYARAAEPDRRLAAQLYSGALAISGIFFSAMWRHARRAGLVDPHADPNRLHALTRHWMLIPIFYGLAFLLAYVDARVSQLMYVVLLLYFSLPGPSVVRWMTGRRAASQARTRTLEGVPRC